MSMDKYRLTEAYDRKLAVEAVGGMMTLEDSALGR
jgi:hypothetical protein